MKNFKGRLSWTERERAWLGSITWTQRERTMLGYKRKQANFIKGEVSLSQPPWEKSSIELKTESEKNGIQEQYKSNRTHKGRAK